MPRDDQPMSLIELVYAVLFRPVSALGYVARARPVKEALVVAFAVYIFQGLLASARLPAELTARLPAEAGLVPGGLPASLGFPVFVTSVLAAAVGWFLATAVFHLLAGFMGHSGSGTALFAGLGFAALPLAFGATGNFILGSLAGLGSLAALTTVAGLAWSLSLVAVAIRETYGTTTGRATAVLFLPLAAIIGIIIIITVTMVIAALPLVNYFGAHSL